MKYYFIILAIVFHMLIAVNGRSLREHNTDSEIKDSIEMKHVRYRPQRHTRNRRQSYSYYGNYQDDMRFVKNLEMSDYLTDMTFSFRDIATSLKQLLNNKYNPHYYNTRRDNFCNCEESIREVLRIVKELAIRTEKPLPPPPPQIIYVQYPAPATVEKTKSEPTKNVSFENRTHILDRVEDKNQIWIDTPRETADYSDDDDGSRPVSFKPKPSKGRTVDPPPFEHGSIQAGMQTTTSAPIRKPGVCELAILSCCGLPNEERGECFASYNCSKSYQTGSACNPDVINMILDKYSKMYGHSSES